MNPNDKKPLPHDPPDWLPGIGSPPDPDLANRYDYLRVVIQEGIEQWAQDQQRGRATTKPGGLAAIFDTTGMLIRIVAEGVEQILSAIVPPATATAATRSISREAKPSPAPPIGITVKSGDIQIRAKWHNTSDSTTIEISAFDRNSAPVPRPLKVVATDETGTELDTAQSLSPAENAQFHDPSPGLYTFHLSWPGGATSFTIEVQEKK